MPNQYYIGESAAQLAAALAQDIPTLYASLSTPANPTASIGLAAVNGIASTFMRSDAAPALSQGIAPTWTAQHTFNGKVVIGNPGSGQSLTITGPTGGFGIVCNAGASSSDYCAYFQNGAGNTAFLVVHGDGGITIGTGTNLGAGTLSVQNAIQTAGGLGIHGATAPAQVTGFGTPTGAAVVANFSGAAATLVNCSNTIAEILIILKSHGIIGA